MHLGLGNPDTVTRDDCGESAGKRLSASEAHSERQRFESWAEVKPRSGSPGKCGKNTPVSK